MILTSLKLNTHRHSALENQIFSLIIATLKLNLKKSATWCFRYIGENDFGCTCDWLELVRMFNKYKVAIADAEDTPSCDDTDIKCGKYIFK